MIEDTPNTESRRCWFRWRGYLFNREEKSDSGVLGDGRTVCAWFTIFKDLEDDGSRELYGFVIKCYG